MDENAYTDANRAVWNAWTREALDSDHHRDLETVRAGGSSLRDIELAALGDVSGKRLLHLQCNMGADTLSWAKRGAQVTGIDFSAEAIAVAASAAEELGIAATFQCENVLRLPVELDGQTDIAVSTYGTICFLPDPGAWAIAAARTLAPGGRLLLIETHPISTQVDVAQDRLHGTTTLRLHGSYLGVRKPVMNSVRTQAGADLLLHTWSHPLSDVVSAVCDAGLHIDALREYPYTFWRQFPTLEQRRDAWWRWPNGDPQIPLLYSLLATKPGA